MNLYLRKWTIGRRGVGSGPAVVFPKSDALWLSESWGMSAPVQKITFAEMRAAGVRSVLVYCSDYRCSHSTSLDADQWADDIRLSDIAASLREPSCPRQMDDKGGIPGLASTRPAALNSCAAWRKKIERRHEGDMTCA